MRAAAIASFAVLLGLSATACKSTGGGASAPSCDCTTVLTAPIESCAADLHGDLTPLDRPVENLVFEGGGVKGTAYAGALQVLGRREMLAGVRRVGGTSAGSITALLVALGYTPEETTEVVLSIDYDKFRDGAFVTDVVRLVEEYGWYKGDYARCLFECLVERKLGSKQATFADLHERAQADPTFKDLYVVATDLDLRDWVVFSHEDERYRDLPLAEGVRSSMSIPFYFAAQEIGGDTYVDGGVLHNYPIDLFDADGPTPATLGFFLGSLSGGREVTDLEVFTEEVFESLLAVQTDDVCNDPAVIRRTVFIDPLGIGTTDFGLTQAQKCALIRSGAEATQSYFEAPPTACPERLKRPPRVHRRRAGKG